tara:strand:- start:2794 stop:5037 length:2244 start_codon:yes stop_codon:yes gene_type:complete
MKQKIFLLIFFLSTNILFCQNNFYHTDTVQEIRINFYDSNWDNILDSLYVLGDKQRILAQLEINGFSYDSVGVRYKGFSSVSVNRTKNPFNIKLDYVKENQEHFGTEKLKLSNVIQDPSFIREVLTYEFCRNYMPSPKANFANLFINDTLWGIYTNVEAVNKDFLIDHYQSKYNSFFKCNPENLNIQIGGENSNLSNTHGQDSSDYYLFYDIESDYGWTDLYNLIDILNTNSDSVNNVLNVDRVLWMHALNYSVINFDSYIGYGQNYYLYKSLTDQFSPIIWDLNMSFGAFRLTDASQLYFNGFDISQAQNMDPLVHYNYISVSPRPLMQNLFSNDRYRKMYIAHIRTIMQENFINNSYKNRAQFLQNLIDSYVQNDTNKFYTYNDFTTNLTNQVSLVSSICPGIFQLMDERSNYLSNYFGFDGAPNFINSSVQPINFSLGDNLTFSSDVVDANNVYLFYRFGENEIFNEIEMFDDGNHNDGASGDGIYGCILNNSCNSIDYYFYAQNDSAGIFFPERAAYKYLNVKSKINSGSLVINELMSNNKSTVEDNSGKNEDWIELYNSSNFPISTNNLYLSDTISNLLKWKLPNSVIYPDDYLIVWADEDGNQGSDHANFKLSNSGEIVILSNSDSTIVDSISFPTQNQDISFGRSPNGHGDFTMLTPTFKSNNDFTFIFNSTNRNNFKAYPNPFNEKLIVKTSSNFSIKDILGKQVLRNKKNTIINTQNWKSGTYFIHLEDNSVHKIIKL